MPGTKPFRFGVIAEHMTSCEAWVGLARRAEQLGYSTLLIRDHVVPDYFGDQFAPIAAMMSAAAATTTLRVGTMVIDNDFRHPMVLAKEAATIDLLSGGRLELGIGAGWLADEYAKSGIPYDPPGVRISRMIESIQIIKGLWGDSPVTFKGDHYQIDGLNGYPKPVQRPHPPLLIGGGGKRILRFAGQVADIIGVLTAAISSGVMADEPVERMSAMVAGRIEWIREGAGDRFDHIELSIMPTVVVAADRHEAAERHIAQSGWSGLTVDDVYDMPSVLTGSLSKIASQLRDWRERLGFSYIVFRDDRIEELAPVVAELSGT